MVPERNFGSVDRRDDGEYNGVGFVEISDIFVMQGRFFVESDINDRVRDINTSTVNCPAHL